MKKKDKDSRYKKIKDFLCNIMTIEKIWPIMIKNLPKETTEQDLKDMFKEETIDDHKIETIKEGGKDVTTGYVKLGEKDNVQKAISKMNNFKFTFKEVVYELQVSHGITPFDSFDTSCHSKDDKDKNFTLPLIGDKMDEEEELESKDARIMTEEMLIFLINTSEHVKRPKDMLMFIGEYFKEHLKHCKKIKSEETKGGGGEKTLSQFYITYDLLNLLGTACKQFIMKPR